MREVLIFLTCFAALGCTYSHMYKPWVLWVLRPIVLIGLILLLSIEINMKFEEAQASGVIIGLMLWGLFDPVMGYFVKKTKGTE